jgi:hypothetical protein
LKFGSDPFLAVPLAKPRNIFGTKPIDFKTNPYARPQTMGSFDHTKLPTAKNEPSAFEPLTPTGSNLVNCFSKTGYKFATESDFA